MDMIKTAMIAALEKSLGIVTTAADQVGISRQTHYNWMKDDVDYKTAVEDIDNAALDFAESKLMEKMEGVTMGEMTDAGLITYKSAPSDTALIFYLKTKGKKRGYVERTELAGVEGAPIILTRGDV